MAAVKFLADDTAFFRVESLLQKCLESLVKHMNCVDVSCMGYLPMNLKDKCLRLLSLRGAVTDDNLPLLLQRLVRELSLSQSDISDRGLHHTHLCPHLVKLDLNAMRNPNTQVTSSGISYVAQHCPSLRTLYLRRCINISDDAITTVAESCPRLQHLNVGGCHRLTDASLSALGRYSRHLESVNISKADVTDEGVFALANGQCKLSLKELQMANCTRLTDESVEAVIQFCPKLNILIFHGCPLITDESRIALEELRGRNQQMKQVTWTIY